MEYKSIHSYQVFTLDTFTSGGPTTFYGFVKAGYKDFESRDDAESWIQGRESDLTQL